MILLFGTRAVLQLMAVVHFSCPFCHTEARQEVYEEKNRFTLFFIPLFTLSRNHFNRCTNCGGETPLNADQAQRSVEWARRNRV